jgi:molybdenum cofactor cytidylyltransferase
MGNITRGNFLAIVLGGGLGRRMGGAKLFTRYEGKSFAKYIDDSCEKSQIPVLWVLSDSGQKIQLEKELGHGADCCVNELDSGDMFSSIQAGLMGSPLPSPEAFLIWPVDFPFIEHDTISKLLSAYKNCDICQPVHNNRKGHPLLLSRRLLTLAVSAKPTQGLRSFFNMSKFPAVYPLVDDPGVLRNLNRPQDL